MTQYGHLVVEEARTVLFHHSSGLRPHRGRSTPSNPQPVTVSLLTPIRSNLVCTQRVWNEKLSMQNPHCPSSWEQQDTCRQEAQTQLDYSVPGVPWAVHWEGIPVQQCWDLRLGIGKWYKISTLKDILNSRFTNITGLVLLLVSQLFQSSAGEENQIHWISLNSKFQLLFSWLYRANQCLLSTYYVPGIILDVIEIKMIKIRFLFLRRLSFSERLICRAHHRCTTDTSCWPFIELFANTG